MPRLEASAEQDSYCPHEAVAIRLRIGNDGAEPLDIPHPEGPGGLPIYRLTGPAYPEGRHFRGLPPGQPVLFTDTPPPARLTLPPGASWEGVIALREDIRPAEPGEYRLTATLDTKAQLFEAQERSFRIEPFAPALAQLGHGLPPMGAGEGVGAFLQRSARGAMLYSFRYVETRPGIRQVADIDPVARQTLPATATDLLVQVRNGPFFGELRTWLFWREGEEIVGLVETGQLHRLRAGAPGPLVAPALKPVDGAAEVLHLSPDRMELGLARFTAGGAPVEAWRTRLPVPAHLAAAAIAPGADAQRLVVAAAATASGDIVVQAVRYGAATPPTLPPFGGAGSVRPMLEARPGLHLGPDGVGTFGMLVVLANGALGLLEATIPAGAQAAPTLLLTDYGPAPGSVASGAVLYSPDGAGTLTRRDVVVLLRDGTLLHARPGAGLARALSQGPVVAPPLLAPGRDGPYVLMSDPRRGPFLEPLL